jgi:3-phosphoshikimate 1-carboxyvinyltransferase
MDFLDLPAVHAARGTVRLPGSKSISNRVLLLAALSGGATQVRALLDSDDTRVMLDALRTLGVGVQRAGETDDYTIVGVGGAFPVKQAELFLGNAGTAFRSLTAACALSGGDYVLKGVARMHERPIGDLVDALRLLGAKIDYLGEPGYPPLRIHPAEMAGDTTRVRGNVSSQFLTGLMMALPLLQKTTHIEIEGELISRPYISITLAMLRRFGMNIEQDGWTRFTVPADARYVSPGEIWVEGDASSASYFLAAGAIGGGPVRVEGVGADSVQGDVRFADALALMGARIDMGPNWIEARAPESGRLKAIDLDCNPIPDAAMTLAVAALFADGTTTLTNIASWRVKETDRIAAMATELRKVGATVEEGTDYIRIAPPHASRLTPHAVIDTYDDHRMAMCLSLVTLGGVPVRINDPACVNKTFPAYFDEFARIVQ